MTLWRQFVEVFRETLRYWSPSQVAKRTHVWTLRLHKPINVGTPDEPHLYCDTCRTDWPCDELNRLAEWDEKP